MFTKIFKFLTGTKVGLATLINLFFVAGLLAATNHFIGGLVWFVGNVLVILLAFNAKAPTFDNSQMGTNGNTIVDVNEPDPREEQQT